MQDQLLAEYSSSPLRVYAVWFPMLAGDTRTAWNGTTMPDPRVLHYWDDEHAVGKWFAQQVHRYGGIVWDYYYLFGPDAVWENGPKPLIGAGATIYDKREKLLMEFSILVDEVR